MSLSFLSLPSLSSLPIPQVVVTQLSKPLISIARASLLSFFSNLTVGLLEIRTLEGDVLRFSDPTLIKSSSSSTESESPNALLIVRSDYFWLRMFLGADLGFAESYMTGEVEIPDLAACFELFILNRSSLSRLEKLNIASSVFSSIQTLLNKRYANTKAGSLRNIGAHYDISNTMYQAFLSHDMTYSCAIFDTLDQDVSGTSLLDQLSKSNGLKRPSPMALIDSPVSMKNCQDLPTPPSESEDPITDPLEKAQLKKLDTIIQRANIQPGDRVLEIGTGWGSFSIQAVRQTDCYVDSLTLSIEQKTLAEQRISLAGLSNRIQVHLMDYRDMPDSWTNRFDRICSIEMVEAVGVEFLETYFTTIDRVLKNHSKATVVIQSITIPETRFEKYLDSVDFIRKWIFPGGVLPSVTALIQAATKGSKGQLILENLINIGPHYSRTLREWKNRFEINFDQRIQPALLCDHVELSGLSEQEKLKQVQVFKRKWIYYFVYCEVGFTHRAIGDHIFAFTREGNVTLPVLC